MKVAKPYTLLAEHYDRNYADFRESPIRMYGGWLRAPLKGARCICDLACGTGQLAAELAGRGYRVTAVDQSPQMVRLARRRAALLGGRMRVVEGDMRRFAPKERFDVVTCFFDSLNHLERRSELSAVFQRAAAMLDPGGWFVFDMNTKAGVAFCWPDPPEAEEGTSGGVRYWKITRGLPFDARAWQGGVQIDWFLERGGGRVEHVREMYCEVAWSHRETVTALKRAGFCDIEHVDGSKIERRLAPGLRRYYRARKS
ncbi:MAG: class I SAM-dependent methyltransferase [Planctomycetes bacterium]|nr:class I SAM-dependent methyltransferase [Planctomycetota bacterium]